MAERYGEPPKERRTGRRGIRRPRHAEPPQATTTTGVKVGTLGAAGRIAIPTHEGAHDRGASHSDDPSDDVAIGGSKAGSKGVSSWRKRSTRTSGPCSGLRPNLMGQAERFALRHALVTFRFVELLTRTPTPRPLRSSSWGYGFLPDPSPRSSGDCTMPTTPGITNPQAAMGFPQGPSPRSCPDRVRLQFPTASCPRPRASPILELSIPVGSEPSQFRRLHHAHDPGHHQSSRLPIPVGSEPSQLQRLRHTHDPWHPQVLKLSNSRRGPSPRSSSDCPMPTPPGITSLRGCRFP